MSSYGFLRYPGANLGPTHDRVQIPNSFLCQSIDLPYLGGYEWLDGALNGDYSSLDPFSPNLNYNVVLPVYGCNDTLALNYSATATFDDGTCEFPDEYYDCDNNCLSDIDLDGVCDANEIPGCTDIEATNFDPFATDNDGTCEAPVCIDELACNYSEFDY